jgi:ribosome-associated protein
MDQTPPPSGVEVAPGVRITEGELRFSFSRSGGPGGQNVNKLNTKAELRVNPAALRGISARALERLRNASRLTAEGDLQIINDEDRSQERNRQNCLRRLREMIVAAQYEPKVRRKTRPTRSSKERRLESKRAHSEIKRQRRSRYE